MPVSTALFLALTLSPAAPLVSPADRERLDRAALRLPGDTLDQSAWRSAEEITLDLLASEDLPPAEEARRADAAYERVLDGHPAAATPAAAQRVFDRLIAELPAHLKPDAFHYRLTVLDRQGRVAFTTGGGRVYVTKPWVDDLLADADRGEAALAFVLADEIAHNALGQTRRGWALDDVWRMDGVRRVMGDPFIDIVTHRPAHAGRSSGRFDWTEPEGEEADCFALHLCRNAGFDLDVALDAVRAAADSGAPAPRAPTMFRLKRLLMERDGLFDDETTHGLFIYDRESQRLGRCGPRQVGADERPIIFVHGLRGTEYAFGAYLSFFAKRPELAGRPLMVFRFPNNESLSRCGQFMGREMRRVVAAPDKAVFVCHSDGGLVFRWYAEVGKGGFDRAIFLATPQAGTHLADFKLFVDLYRVYLDAPYGLDYTWSDLFGEGDGMVRLDLHPDSLFLRRLGREKPPVAKYQIFYGQVFDFVQSLELQAAFLVAKKYAKDVVAAFVPFPGCQARLIRLVDEAPLPEEISRGDFAVSARSAALPGVAKQTSVPLIHEAFRYEPDMMRRVFEAIMER